MRTPSMSSKFALSQSLAIRGSSNSEAVHPLLPATKGRRICAEAIIWKDYSTAPTWRQGARPSPSMTENRTALARPEGTGSSVSLNDYPISAFVQRKIRSSPRWLPPAAVRFRGRQSVEAMCAKCTSSFFASAFCAFSFFAQQLSTDAAIYTLLAMEFRGRVKDGVVVFKDVPPPDGETCAWRSSL